MNVLNDLLEIQWREPLWFILLIQPALLLIIRGIVRKRSNKQYVDPHLRPWAIAKLKYGGRIFSQNSLYFLSWLLITISLAGPRLPVQLVGEQQTSGNAIMIVLDISRSMYSTDIVPSRLRRAQIEITELLEHAPHDRIGIVVFAARPHLYVPLTSDHKVLEFYVHTVDQLVAPTNGSIVIASVEMALDELSHLEQPSAIILISDGDFQTDNDHSLAEYEAITKKLQQAHIPLYSLGIGTIEGDAVPATNGEWLKFEEKTVISQLNTVLLTKLALDSNGRYKEVADDDSDWTQLYERGIAKHFVNTANEKNAQQTLWHELYHWTLVPAIILLWYCLIPYRFHLTNIRDKYRKPLLDNHDKQVLSKGHKISVSGSQSILLVFILVSCGILFPQTKCIAGNLEQQAQADYEQQQYSLSLQKYKNISGYTGRFGEGANLYKIGSFNEAIQQFTQAVLLADSDTQRASALFNLGNSYFQLGNYAAAISNYQDIFLYQPAHIASKHNLAFTQSLKLRLDAQIERTNNIRMGKGPQQARANEDIPIDQSISIAIDQIEDDQSPPLPTVPGVTSNTLQLLLEKGLEHIRLAATGKTISQQQSIREDMLALTKAQLRMEELQDRQSLLWNRLFEIEEDFAAPLEESQPVPGIRPW